MFSNKLGGYLGKEDLSTEFKEVCSKISTDLYLTFEEAEEILDKKIWNNKLNGIINDNIEIYIKNIFPKYLSSFCCSKIQGTLYFGVHDYGEITGIPYMGNLELSWIKDKIKETIESNIKSKEPSNLLNYIDIKIEKLEIDPVLLHDEASELYKKYKKDSIKINDIKMEYNSKRVKWLYELSRYSRKLIEVINSTESRKEMIDYIIERKDIFDNDESMNNIIRLLESDEYIKIPEFNKLQIRKKDKNDVLYWLVTYKDFYTDKISKQRPCKPHLVKNFNPFQIIGKLSPMREIFSKINGVNYYLVKIIIKGDQINEDIYYKYNKDWVKKIRLVSDSGNPYSE